MAESAAAARRAPLGLAPGLLGVALVLAGSALALGIWQLRQSEWLVLGGGVLLPLLCGLILCLWQETRLQAAAHRRAASEQRLVLECLSEGVVSANTQGEFGLFNRTARAILGAGAVWGPNARWPEHYRLFEPDGSTPFPAEQLPLVRAIRGESCDDVEIGYRKPGRAELGTLSASARPLRDERENVVGGVVVFRDVTEQKRLAAERKQLEARLLESRKLDSIGQLTSGFAHEINTPAQFVRDNLCFLEHALPPVLALLAQYREALGAAAPPAAVLERLAAAERESDLAGVLAEVPAALGQALEGVDQIANLVAALRDSTQPGAAARQPLDLNACVRHALSVASTAWRPVAELELDLDEKLPEVPGLASELHQALLNIAINAAQALGESERVRLGARGRLAVRTRAEGPWACIEIEDSGPGMPPEVRERIFEPFFTTRGVGQGSGLGLTVARRIVVNAHGGELDVWSEPGRGTRFTIRLHVLAGYDPGRPGSPASAR